MAKNEMRDIGRNKQFGIYGNFADRATLAATEAEKHGFSETARALKLIFSRTISGQDNSGHDRDSFATRPGRRTRETEDLTAL